MKTKLTKFIVLSEAIYILKTSSPVTKFFREFTLPLF